jgi:hypothetical protein
MGCTLQVVGKKHAPATDVAIILSMEAVFAALFGYFGFTSCSRRGSCLAAP